jgi:hypothetical protein
MLGHQANAGGEPNFRGRRCHAGQRQERVEDRSTGRSGQLPIERVGIFRRVLIDQDDVFRHPQGRNAKPLRIGGDRSKQRAARHPVGCHRE